MKIARVYLRVSTDSQEISRQNKIISDAKSQGFYIAGVYSEHASGNRLDRKELNRLINDLQDGEYVIAEKMDRITRLPLDQAETLIKSIKNKGAKLAIPDVIDLSDIINVSDSEMARIVLEATQDLLLKITIQTAHDDYITRKKRQREGIDLAKSKGIYQGRKADKNKHNLIFELDSSNKYTKKEIAKLSGVSLSSVYRILKLKYE